MRGWLNHGFYTILLTVYVKLVYLDDVESLTRVRPIRNTLTVLLSLGIVYPIWYECSQIYGLGMRAYLSNMSEILDMVYIWACMANIIMSNMMSPQEFPIKVVMALMFLL